jgi:hypothetical protein
MGPADAVDGPVDDVLVETDGQARAIPGQSSRAVDQAVNDAPVEPIGDAGRQEDTADERLVVELVDVVR